METLLLIWLIELSGLWDICLDTAAPDDSAVGCFVSCDQPGLGSVLIKSVQCPGPSLTQPGPALRKKVGVGGWWVATGQQTA